MSVRCIEYDKSKGMTETEIEHEPFIYLYDFVTDNGVKCYVSGKGWTTVIDESNVSDMFDIKKNPMKLLYMSRTNSTDFYVSENFVIGKNMKRKSGFSKKDVSDVIEHVKLSNMVLKSEDIERAQEAMKMMESISSGKEGVFSLNSMIVFKQSEIDSKIEKIKQLVTDNTVDGIEKKSMLVKKTIEDLVKSEGYKKMSSEAKKEIIKTSMRYLDTALMFGEGMLNVTVLLFKEKKVLTYFMDKYSIDASGDISGKDEIVCYACVYSLKSYAPDPNGMKQLVVEAIDKFMSEYGL